MSYRSRPGLPDREEVRRRLEGFLNPPLTLAGAAIALVIVCQVVAPPGVWSVPLWGIAAVLYAMILLEFASKVSLSRDRLGYLRTHWAEAVFAVLPVLRPLTYLRHVRVYRVVEAVFALFFGRHPNGQAVRLGMAIFRRRQLGKLAFTSLMLTLIFAELFYLAEIHAKGTQISSFGGALWFAASTITTVGSEVYPVTFAGRLVGWALMIYAVTVFTYLAASIASVMVGGDSQQSSSDSSASGPPAGGGARGGQPAGQSDRAQSGDGPDQAPRAADRPAAGSGQPSTAVPAPPADQARELLREAEQLLAQVHAMLAQVSRS